MTRNKYLSLNGFRKTLLKANVTVLFLILSHNATISRLNRIGRQLQMVELTAGETGSELAVPFAFSSLHETSTQHARKSRSAGKPVRSKKKTLEGLRRIYR